MGETKGSSLYPRMPHRTRASHVVAVFTSKQHLGDACKCFCIVSLPYDRKWSLAIRRDEELLQADLYFRLVYHLLKSNVRKLIEER